MTNLAVLFAAFLKSFLLVNKTEGFLASQLGEECIYDLECQEKDSNSYCSMHEQRLISICSCKTNYHTEVVNKTEKCIYGDFSEEDKEGLTAAPIILCFMGCVLVEAFCLLAFRYWKKHRRAGFTRHGTLHLQAISLTDARFTQGQRGPVISFMITPEMESVITEYVCDSGTSATLPPPYCQTAKVGAGVQGEEPPPPYEEAVKQSASSQCEIPSSLIEKSNRRKLSC